MSRIDDFLTFSKIDLHKLIIDNLNIKTNLIMIIVAEGITLSESDELNPDIHQIINYLNRQIMQHVFRTIDYAYKSKSFFIMVMNKDQITDELHSQPL